MAVERRGWEAWVMSLKYYEAYRMKPERHLLRQKLVSLARDCGLKAAARLLGCSRNTARKWMRRYQPGKPSSLVEMSRRPRRCPHQTSCGQEGLVVRLRKQTGFGAERLKQHFDLKPSIGAIRRMIRQHGLSARRRTKPQTKRCLRAIKRSWPLFGKLVADTKFLQDIPEYWPQMQHLRLPRFQYTVREVVSGLCFCGSADEISKTSSCLMAQAVCRRLQHHGVQLGSTHGQTDHGAEFLDSKEQPGLPSLVRSFGCDPRFIPQTQIHGSARFSESNPPHHPWRIGGVGRVEIPDSPQEGCDGSAGGLALPFHRPCLRKIRSVAKRGRARPPAEPRQRFESKML